MSNTFADGTAVRAAPHDPSGVKRAWLIFAALSVLVVGYKFFMAGQIPLHADGSFYWLESKHPDWAYSDVPAITPLLVRLGVAIAGDTTFGARLPFLVIGALIPFAIVVLGRSIVGLRDAILAGALFYLIPLPTLNGLFAGPDTPLVLLQILTLHIFRRAVFEQNPTLWMSTGFLVVLGINTHYRFAFLVVAMILFLFLTRTGRANLKTWAPWIAGTLAALGAFPVIYFNVTNAYGGIGFHFVDRHPWEFNPAGLAYIIHQALAVSPVIFVLLVTIFLRGLRRAIRGSDEDALLVLAAALYVGFFIAVSPWSAQNAFVLHWTIFGYIPLILFLPGVLRELWTGTRPRLGKVVVWLGLGLGTVLTAFTLSLFAMSPYYDRLPPVLQGGTREFLPGWPKVAERVLEIAEEQNDPNVSIITDTVFTASQLAFWTKRKDGIYTPDNHATRQFGRRLQLSIWEFDEPGLRRNHEGGQALVLAEVSPYPYRRKHFLEQICDTFQQIEFLETVPQPGAGRSFDVFLGRGIRPETVGEDAQSSADRSRQKDACMTAGLVQH